MSRWPMIDLALATESITPVDAAFAEMILRDIPQADENAAAFLCHLTYSSREGHLCVHVDKGRLSPDPKDYWKIPTETFYKGVQTIPFVELNNEEDLPDFPICREGNRYYLQKNWVYESMFKRHLQRLLTGKPSKTVDKAALSESLNPLQREAVLNALDKSFSVISGGPGTGKTYTVGCLVKALGKDFKIAVAAPTGKAASNLQSCLPKDLEVEAKTLHSLLGIRKGKSLLTPQMLPYDLVLVDESSMIDVKMMALLFASIKPGGRLILLGDPHQLPPVEAGSVFADMLKNLDPSFHTCLKTCLRAELQKLIDFSEGIKNGVFLNELAARKPLDEETLFAFIEGSKSHKILSPLRKGPFGVESVNLLLYKRLSHLPVPIIVTKNDYQRELFNGDMGILDGEWAYFKGDKKISKMTLPDYEPAYCLSVHKSQGSEFDRVLLLLPEGSERFGREALYTAATRAKKELIIAGADEVIQAALNKSSARMSGL